MKALLKFLLFAVLAQIIINHVVCDQNDTAFIATDNSDQQAVLHDSVSDFLVFVVNENSKKQGLLQFSSNVVPPQSMRILSKNSFLSLTAFVSSSVKKAFKFVFLSFDYFPKSKIFASSKAYFVLALRRIVI